LWSSLLQLTGWLELYKEELHLKDIGNRVYSNITNFWYWLYFRKKSYRKL